MNRAENIGSWVLLIAGAGLVATLLTTEWRVWVGARGDAAKRPRARARLVWRAFGGALLLATVVLVRFPDTAGWSLGWRLARLGSLLGLCLVVLGVALWDFRIVRRELRHEVQGFVADSAQDLRKYLETLAVDNPELAEKLRKVLAGEGVATASIDRVASPPTTGPTATPTDGKRPSEARP